MMKKIMIILLIVLNFSCQDKQIDKLKSKISELEMKNKELEYFKNNYEENNIINSQMIGIPELRDFKVGEKGVLKVGFLKYGDLKAYNVYQIIKKTNVRKLLFSNLTNSSFKFEYTPISKDDNEIHLIAEFESDDNGRIEIPLMMELYITD